MAIDRDEFESWMGVLRDDIKGVNDRLDQLNGRTRGNEVAVGVLQDRTTELIVQAREARWSRIIWGAGSGAGVVGVVEFLKSLIK